MHRFGFLKIAELFIPPLSIQKQMRKEGKKCATESSELGNKQQQLLQDIESFNLRICDILDENETTLKNSITEFKKKQN